MRPISTTFIKKLFFTTLFILTFSTISIAQKYEPALPNVEARMSENVSEGKPQLEGISFEYNFTINSKNHSMDDVYFLNKISSLLEDTYIGSSTASNHLNERESSIVISSDKEILTADLKAFISESGYEVISYSSIYTLK
jgi:hypothetical protein